MKYLLAILVTFCIAGCTKEEVKSKICSAGKTAATIVAHQVSQDLACTNTDAIKASIEERLISLKICQAAEEKLAEGAKQGLISAKSAIGDALCAPVIEGLFAGGLTQLPQEWGCTGGTLAAEAKAKLIAECSKAF